MTSEIPKVYSPRDWMRRRMVWLTAKFVARMIILTASMGIMVGAPLAFIFLADLSEWRPAYYLGVLSGLVMAFALWWAYLVLYD